MSSSTSLSPTPSGVKDFPSHELDDHRQQPESLPVKTSFDTQINTYEEAELSDSYAPCRNPPSNFSVNSQPTLSPDILGRVSQNHSYRHENRSDGTQGILLNNHNFSDLQYRSTPNISRPLTQVPTNSLDDEDSSSCIMIDNETEEDVCFPMTESDERCAGIDFSELERFTELDKNRDNSARNYYKPAFTHYASTHRPLVPQAMIHDFSTDHTISYESTEKNEEEKGELEPEVSSDDNNETVEQQYVVEQFPSVTFGARRTSFTMDRFSFFAADLPETIHAPDLSSLIKDEKSFEELFASSKGTWWLDCLDPTDVEMKAIAKAFGIHPLTAEDIRMKETREKVELFKNYYFVCFHTFEADNESEEFLEPINVYIVVFREGILSFHFTPIQHTLNVRKRIRQLRDYVKVSSDWICYAIIDDITDGFAPIMREIELETDVIEDSVFIARESDFGPMLLRIGEARRKVMVLLRLLTGKADVIKMFAKRCNEQWDNAPRSEISLYLGDIQDHIITMHQNLSAYEKIFSRSHANYLAQLQVESVNANNRVTKVLGRVTLIGTILVPLNLVTGLFGMNVKVPGEGGSGLQWFFGIIGFIVAIVVVCSWIAHKWLGEAESDEPPRQTVPSRFRRRLGGGSIRSCGSGLRHAN